MSSVFFDRQSYIFSILAMTIIVAVDRLNGQTVIAQIISGGLVTLLILAYIVTACQLHHVLFIKDWRHKDGDCCK